MIRRLRDGLQEALAGTVALGRRRVILIIKSHQCADCRADRRTGQHPFRNSEQCAQSNSVADSDELVGKTFQPPPDRNSEEKRPG